MARLLSGLLLLSLALATAAAGAEPKANRLFGALHAASHQRPEAIGSYARGCAAGLQELPETGPTWQAMRLSRNRNWAHPAAIDFIRRLGATARRFGWDGLYIGDISQPRGGPMTSSHRSHQIGLDIDIWMRPARRLNLSRRARERIGSISVRTPDKRHLNDNWTPTHAAILEAAARDPAVARIFVTAPAKIDMCRHASRADAHWLEKIRPLYGHNDHFHVRLKCPPGSTNCIRQTPTVSQLSQKPGGCDETLMWWVTDYLDPPEPSAEPSEPAPRKRHPRDYTMRDLPRQCTGVLSSR